MLQMVHLNSLGAIYLADVLATGPVGGSSFITGVVTTDTLVGGNGVLLAAVEDNLLGFGMETGVAACGEFIMPSERLPAAEWLGVVSKSDELVTMDGES